jgi:tRNA (adenine57-N1/adenine58-N1)-methyltransferase
VATSRSISKRTVELPSSLFKISNRKYCSSKEDAEDVTDRDPPNISAALTKPDDKSFVKPKYGDKVMLMALYKPREWVIKLQERQSTPTGNVPIYHKDVVEAGYGGIVNIDGKKHLVKRLAYEDYIVTKDRVATPSYPKDMGTISLMLDLKNGDRVLEAGSGSGMLSLFLSRAVAPRGEVHSFEVREEFSQKAKDNADGWDPEHNIKFYVGDVNNCEISEPFDACVLDMMTPWLALEKATSLLKTGSSIVCVVPNVTQVVMMEELREEKKLPLYLERMTEVMNRDWTVHLPSFHPKFRSVSHTTFLVQYRKLGNEVIVNLLPREERQRASAEKREKFRAISKARMAADKSAEDNGDENINHEDETKHEK